MSVHPCGWASKPRVDCAAPEDEAKLERKQTALKAANAGKLQKQLDRLFLMLGYTKADLAESKHEPAAPQPQPQQQSAADVARELECAAEEGAAAPGGPNTSPSRAPLSPLKPAGSNSSSSSGAASLVAPSSASRLMSPRLGSPSKSSALRGVRSPGAGLLSPQPKEQHIQLLSPVRNYPLLVRALSNLVCAEQAAHQR